MGITTRSFALLLLVALALAACNNDDTPPTDAATPRDTNTGGNDTGGGDEDAATPDEDAGGDVDAAPDVDSGSAPVGCALDFSECDAFEDMTGMAAVTIGVTGTGPADFAYDPHCVRVSTGTVVTITASALHPLNNASCSPAGSPLPTVPAVLDDDYTFTAAGAYGMFCTNHGTNTGAGMAGLIVVE